MWTLSGFGDEIDPEPEVHLPVLAGEGIRYLDFRAAWGTNVLALSDDQLTRPQCRRARQEKRPRRAPQY